MAQIEKQFGKNTVMRLGDHTAEAIQAISTGSLGLDIALGIGGLPKGRIVEIYGPESSGKTTLTLQVIAECQRQGGTAAFIDAEHALDPGAFDVALGSDVNKRAVFDGVVVGVLAHDVEARERMVRGKSDAVAFDLRRAVDECVQLVVCLIRFHG